MKKHTLFLFLFSMTCLQALPQEAKPAPRLVKSAEKVNQQSQKAAEASASVVDQAQQTANNVNQVAANVKTIVKIFEPILRFRLKKKTGTNEGNNSAETVAPTSTETADTGTSNSQLPAATYGDAPAQYVTQNDIAQGVPITTESAAYNTDGTANLGSQNNNSYGCYIDVMKGEIMDDVDAAGQPGSVDLIFTATNAFNEQVPMYAFLTPAYVKNDAFAYNFFKGTKYKDRNIPPAAWEQVNESEVSMTTLTPAQFEKIQTNKQLAAVVKQVKSFGQKVESRTKLNGKVIAVKTEMGNRTAYGLICILDHFGTTGDNGYLKIKIKVTGFDADGDGIPDANLYNQ